MNAIKQCLLLFEWIASPIYAISHTQTIPKNATYPGGVAVIQLKVTGTAAPRVYYEQRRVLVINAHNHWVAIVGIPLTARVGTHNITIKIENNYSTRQTFMVHSKDYPLRHITISDTSKVTPNATLARKVLAQSHDMLDILSKWRDVPNVPLAFILPVQGRLSSPFGLKRIYNEVKKDRHTAVDIAAPTGTPITAAANGTVLATRNYVTTGNVVFIDHGQGLITYYCHMHSTHVKADQEVVQGEMLGSVGTTGRVTGPHVHWGMVLNGIEINPLLFAKMMSVLRCKFPLASVLNRLPRRLTY